MKDGGKGGSGEASDRSLGWDPIDLVGLVTPAPSFHDKFQVTFECPIPMGQDVIEHGTFCSVSLDDLHMCS